ncbi:MAG: HEAT repeat domain-containing protein [Eubacteriales bacterium]
MEKQLKLISDGKTVEEYHKRYLQKRLRITGNLIAFDKALETLVQKYKEETQKYFLNIHSVFIYLSFQFRHKDNIKTAYFAYIIGKFNVLKNISFSPVINEMMVMLHEESLYCRENALYAIYSSENCINVVKALLFIDKCNRFHHSDLLSDRLLSFKGSPAELAEALWKSFNQFSVRLKVVILDYIRYSNIDMRDDILKLLSDQTQDDEIRFSCIRYFGRHYHAKAYPILIGFLEEAEKYRWEYGAVTAAALSAYPGEKTVSVLKKSLCNSNWYIRFNASLSLQKFNLRYTDLIDILDGSDRYAREILLYRIEREALNRV